MRAACFHGRREIGGGGLFLEAARIFGGAANRAGLSAQVRTPGFPSPPGSPDRAVVKVAEGPLDDLAIPAVYDLEVVCDPLLAVVPPMGNALERPGGILVLDTPDDHKGSGIRILALDLSAIAARHGSDPAAAHLGAALAAWEEFDERRIEAAHVAQAYRDVGRTPMQAEEAAALAEAAAMAREKLA